MIGSRSCWESEDSREEQWKLDLVKWSISKRGFGRYILLQHTVLK